jgi:hypothetical protein
MIAGLAFLFYVLPVQVAFNEANLQLSPKAAVILNSITWQICRTVSFGPVAVSVLVAMALYFFGGVTVLIIIHNKDDEKVAWYPLAFHFFRSLLLYCKLAMVGVVVVMLMSSIITVLLLPDHTYWLKQLKRTQDIVRLTETFALSPSHDLDSLYLDVIKASGKVNLREAAAQTGARFVNAQRWAVYAGCLDRVGRKREALAYWRKSLMAGSRDTIEVLKRARIAALEKRLGVKPGDRLPVPEIAEPAIAADQEAEDPLMARIRRVMGVPGK